MSLETVIIMFATLLIMYCTCRKEPWCLINPHDKIKDLTLNLTMKQLNLISFVEGGFAPIGGFFLCSSEAVGCRKLKIWVFSC